MNLIASFSKAGKPQRELLTHGDATYQRIFFLVGQKGETQECEPPLWTRKYNFETEFSNVDASKALELETLRKEMK